MYISICAHVVTSNVEWFLYRNKDMKFEESIVKTNKSLDEMFPKSLYTWILFQGIRISSKKLSVFWTIFCVSWLIFRILMYYCGMVLDMEYSRGRMYSVLLATRYVLDICSCLGNYGSI